MVMFIFAAMFLMSCGGAGKEPTDLITFGTAMSHCFSTTSYIVWLVIGSAVLAVDVVYCLRKYNSGDLDSGAITWRIVIGLAIFLACLLARPAEIAANTTVEQAARGAWIGY